MPTKDIHASLKNAQVGSEMRKIKSFIVFLLFQLALFLFTLMAVTFRKSRVMQEEFTTNGLITDALVVSMVINLILTFIILYDEN